MATRSLEKRQGVLVHLVRNRAVGLVRLQSTHASIESVVVETTEWAKRIKSRRVNTVDQELYHVIDTIHASPRGAENDVYVAVLVTDNVAADVTDIHVTLEAAEETIADTAKLRQNFFLNVFRAQGILKREGAGRCSATGTPQNRHVRSLINATELESRDGPRSIVGTRHDLNSVCYVQVTRSYRVLA